MGNTKKKNDLEEFLNMIGGDVSLEPSLSLADPDLVSYYKDYKDRILWIDKEIGDDLFREIRTIVQWNREDEEAKVPVKKRKPIKLLIHSFGGSLDSAFSLIDVMNASKTPIMTVNMNCALSAGGLILLNGHKGLRYCMKMSEALIHSGSGGNGGSFEAVVAQTENYKRLVSMMQENILSHTNVDQKTLNKWKGKEIYLYAKDQVEYGLVDHVVENISEIF